MQKVKFGIIGYGKIGKRYEQLLMEIDQAELVAIVDPLVEKSEYNSLLLKEINELFQYKLDIVVIATPNGLHEAHAVKVLSAGYNVIIEKPMALSKLSCEHILQTAFNHNKQVFCVMQNRFSPISKWLKMIVDKGILGKIYFVQTNLFWNRDDRYYTNEGWQGTKDLDGGILFTQFSHFVDMIYWLFGDLKNIHSKVYNFANRSHSELEDTGIAYFDFIKGGSGTIQYSTALYEKNLESTLTIIAEKGTIKVAGQYMDEVVFSTITGDNSFESISSGSKNIPNINHKKVIKNAIEVVQGKSAIAVNALDGMKVVEIIEKMCRMEIG